MKKFLLVSLLFFTLFFYFSFTNYQNKGHFSNTNDYLFHLSLARGECLSGVGNYYPETCKNYPPAMRWISGPFSSNEIVYFLFILFILIILIPGLIYFKTKSIWSLLIFYSSSTVFNIIYASIFAQLLVTLLVVLLLQRERVSIWIDLPILLIAPFVHHSAIYAIIPIILYKLLKDKLKIPLFFPEIVILKEGTLTFSTLFKLGPIIHWWYSLKLDFSKLLLIAYFIIGSILFDFRIILFVPIFWAYWLPEKIQEYSKNKLFTGINIICYIVTICCQFFIWFRDIWAL